MRTNKPTKRNRILIVVIIVFGISGFLIWSNSYVEFKPIVFDLKTEKYIPVKPDPGFNTNLKVVLRHRNISYKEDASGRILIKRKIRNDKELIWNITNWTQDAAWLNSHRD